MNIFNLGKTALLGTLAAAFSVGAAVGVVAERAIIGRNVRGHSPHPQEFPSLSQNSLSVIANDGVRLHVEVDTTSDTTKPTIVFLHGFGLNHNTFYFQRRDLQPHANLVFYDQRGHGKSEQGESETHTINMLADDLACVLKSTVGSGNLILVGHSMGGMAIQAFAIRYPELWKQVKAVVLTCTSAGGLIDLTFGLPKPLGAIIHKVTPPITNLLSERKDLWDVSREAGSDLVLLMTRRYSFESEVPAEYTEFVAAMHANVPVEIIGNFLKDIEQFDGNAALEKMAHVKTIVVSADSDLMIPKVHSERIIQQLPSAQFIPFADTGHMLPLERHFEFSSILRKLLQETV
jgi:pimeloyl-ACP methyl ester carboxylesterase